jgi:hypothetical protein
MYSELDKIDVSMYLIYEDIEKIMSEINKDYDDILQFMTINEFKKYIKTRYGLR